MRRASLFHAHGRHHVRPPKVLLLLREIRHYQLRISQDRVIPLRLKEFGALEASLRRISKPHGYLLALGQDKPLESLLLTYLLPMRLRWLQLGFASHEYRGGHPFAMD